MVSSPVIFINDYQYNCISTHVNHLIIMPGIWSCDFGLNGKGQFYRHLHLYRAPPATSQSPVPVQILPRADIPNPLTRNATGTRTTRTTVKLRPSSRRRATRIAGVVRSGRGLPAFPRGKGPTLNITNAKPV
jgi:hypothetical protein